MVSRLLEIGPEWMSLLNREAAKTKSQRPWLSLPFHRGPEQTKVPDPAEPVAGRDDDRLTGQARTLEIATRDDPITGGSWTPGVILQLLSALSRLSRDGGDISTIVRGLRPRRQPIVPDLSWRNCSIVASSNPNYWQPQECRYALPQSP